MARDRFNRTALAAPARWRRSQIAETVASFRVSAPSYRLAENIGFVPIVKSELKLIQVQRQILLADMMIGSDHAASANSRSRARPSRATSPCKTPTKFVKDRMLSVVPLNLRFVFRSPELKGDYVDAKVPFHVKRSGLKPQQI